MSLLKKFKSKPVIKSHLLVWLAALYFSFGLNFSFWRFIFNNLEINGISTFVFALSLPFFIFAPLYILLNLIIVPYAAKPLLIFLVLISSATNYWMYNLGVHIDSDMVRNAFETSVRETADLITFSCFAWVFATGIIPAAAVAMTKIKYHSWGKETARRAVRIMAVLLIAAGFAAISYKEYVSFGRNNREARKILNTLNYIVSTVRYFQLKYRANMVFRHVDENAQLVPFEDPHLTVLVLIVGEAARAKNFSLYGYERETNPLLKKQDVVHFADMTSCGTATAVSVPCMFSHLKREDFNVENAKYQGNLLDILKTAGYRVLFRENNDGCKGVCNRVEVQKMERANTHKYCDGKYCHDEILLEGLPEILAGIKQNTVIVLHMIGSHGPAYHDRYPARFRKFTPTCDTADIQNCTKEQVVNTYDNTILYSDYIISSAINMLKKHPEYESGLIYVSDHGQSLGENNIYLHGFPYKVAPKEQKQIPMILWMSKTMQRWDYIDYECLKREAKQNAYSHDNLFHSVLGLMEIKSHTYDREYDIFRNCRTKDLPQTSAKKTSAAR